LFALAFGLVRELSGEAALQRAERAAHVCDCGQPPLCGMEQIAGSRSPSAATREQLYVQAQEKRFRGINRCC
jgi:carbon starvation protein